MKAAKRQEKRVTGSQIRKILGPAVDDDIITSVMETGADLDEIMQACEWLDDDDYMGAGLQRTMHSKIQSVYDILLADRQRDEGR
jgi:hypothetical protein